MANSESSSFFLLDERIQRFIWTEGWDALRDAQETAIPHIVNGDRDVIIAAATAAGKTEAAFFPALTYIVGDAPASLIVYVSPLKALINDQFGRLDRLCEQLEISVWPWHGDISGDRKQKFFKKPSGVLLITPESLEAMLCTRGSQVAHAFQDLGFIIVDELHAFIGSERGKQLQSLMHRIDLLLKRTVPRIGLSATLGDMNLAKQFLRPNQGQTVQLIESKSGGGRLMVQLKGYEEPAPPPQSEKGCDGNEEDEAGRERQLIAPGQVSAHMYEVLRGNNNLVFPNSRRNVELYTHQLNRRCELHQVPNEFWPHHGSLSKEIRAETEAALRQKEVPATAICTSTLELGIDIGAVKSVVQIGPPHTVASLRQRLGRSGRRKGEPAILRGYVIEDELHAKSSLTSQLRWETVQFAAMISLLAEGWFEPPKVDGAHLSTLVQQILSVISQDSGVKIGDLYRRLCGADAPFAGLTPQEFTDLIKHLGSQDLLMQESSGDLLPGTLGEKFVNHYHFYAAFASDEEYRIVTGGRTLGSIPIKFPLRVGDRILFAGKTWKVIDVDDEQKAVFVVRTSGGVPPPFSEGAGGVHRNVRDRMRAIYESGEDLPFLDQAGKRFLAEGRRAYRDAGLATAKFLDLGGEILLTTWLSDAGNEAICNFLALKALSFFRSDIGVMVSLGEGLLPEFLNSLSEAGRAAEPAIDSLLAEAMNLQREKWDWSLPPLLLQKSFASQHLDLPEAMAWMATCAN